jgi:hypothetical protein
MVFGGDLVSTTTDENIDEGLEPRRSDIARHPVQESMVGAVPNNPFQHLQEVATSLPLP